MTAFLSTNWLSLITFFFGALLGWLTNHWYAVHLRMPKLDVNGSGSGANFYGSGYRYVSISIGNQFRQLGFRLPMTVILGKRLDFQIGSKIIARDTANRVTARLLDPSGSHIAQLFWLNNETPQTEMDIVSGQSANLILFIRRDDASKEYLVYQPTSGSDLSPRTSRVASFDSSMNFFVEVSYMFGSKSLKLPVKVKIGYDGSLMFEHGGGGGSF